MRTSRQRARRLCLSALLLGAALPALAQDAWPSRPIKIVTPAPAGVAPDVFARLFAEQMSKSLGQTVIVENRPGAAAILGTDVVAKSPADGYTLLYGFNSIVTMNPHLYAKLPFDPQKDLVPITQLLAGAFVFVAHNDFPGNGFREMLELARRSPNAVSYGSYGPGSASDLGFKIVEEAAKVSFLHVPYKQGVMNDLIGGQIQLTLEPTGFVLPFIQSGKVKALAVTSPRRLPLLPEVPTVSEILPGIEVAGWHGFFAPRGTPADVIARLDQEFQRILALPEMQRRIVEIGFQPTGLGPKDTAAAIARESEQWGRVIRAKSIRLD